MKKTLLSTLILATLGMASAVATAQENPWMVRVRATNLNWENDRSTAALATTLDVHAKNLTIPEVDISYFFTKNIVAELVLTYPQRVDVYAGSSNLGSVTALPPTLLAQYHFTNFGQLKPYIGAGVNYTRFGSRNLASGNAYSVDKDSWGYAFQVGTDYMITKNWGINLDIKYLDIKTNVVDNSTGASAGKLTLSPLATSVGVTYKF